MTATVAILPVAHAAAHAMLPPGLDLAAQGVMRGDRHPLVLILGRQSGVRARLLPFGADYLEFILAVPFVEHRAARARVAGPFCYPARLYLDRALPTLAGRLLYAYAKRRAALRMIADSYGIAEPADGAPLLEAHSWIAGPALEPSRVVDRTLFDLPVISHSRGGGGTPSRISGWVVRCSSRSGCALRSTARSSPACRSVSSGSKARTATAVTPFAFARTGGSPARGRGVRPRHRHAGRRELGPTHGSWRDSGGAGQGRPEAVTWLPNGRTGGTRWRRS
jgi:hypothetical protein